MAKLKVNIFYVFAATCILLLAAYFWVSYLPQISGSPQYEGIRNMVILLTVILIALAAIQIFLAIEREKKSP